MAVKGWVGGNVIGRSPKNFLGNQLDKTKRERERTAIILSLHQGYISNQQHSFLIISRSCILSACADIISSSSSTAN